MGGAAEDSIRLYMLPGMGHCRSGEDPDAFDAIGTLAQWFEKGQAPSQLLASHRVNGVVDRTRPICPYRR
jgi:feruloyl esterase